MEKFQPKKKEEFFANFQLLENSTFFHLIKVSFNLSLIYPLLTIKYLSKILFTHD